MTGIIFNSVTQFVEQVGRRFQSKFGDEISYNFVYIGPQSAYTAWNPQLGSSPPGFPLMYLNTISKVNQQAGVMEVTLSYLGTDQVNVVYTNVSSETDLLQKTFSWSGAANYPVSSGGTLMVIATIEIQYTTVSVTFQYTTYKYQNGAMFQGQAGSFVLVVNTFSQISVQPVAVGRYTYAPTLTFPIRPMLTLTRYSCKQLTPPIGKPTGTGVWRCIETWELDFTMGSLGFYEPNYVHSS